MKKTILFILFLSCRQIFAQVSFDTTGGRYSLPIFDSVRIYTDIPYSRNRNATGQLQNLSLDIYEPKGDTLAQRPVIVLLHGGGFIQGSKADMAYSCTQFAKKGFVTVSVQYRLGFTALTSAGVTQMVVRATQDMKNAIRFLRKSAIENNPYKIHPDFIFGGGFSAGAITALHVAYMDKLSEVPANQNITSLDSLHNNGLYQGLDWRFKAAINIAGAIGDTNWIEPGNTPVVSFHGTADATVPYVSGSFGLPGVGSILLFGSKTVDLRCKSLGINTSLRPFEGAGHDYTSGLPWAADTTESRISKFLVPFLTQPTTGLDKTLTSKSEIKLYLAEKEWQIEIPENSFEFLVLDLAGKMLAVQKQTSGSFLKLPFSNHHRILKIKTEKGLQKSLFLPSRI